MEKINNINKVCRTCMSKSYLNPIFVNDDYRQYSLSIFVATGIKVEVNDGLSQKMCTQCINFLNKYLKFRKKCKEVETELLRLKEQLQNTNNENIVTETELTEIKLEGKTCNNVYTEFSILDEDDKPLKYLIDDTSNDAIEALDNGNSSANFIETTETEQKCAEIEISETKQLEIDNCNDILYDSDNKKGRVICKLCQKNLSVRSIGAHMARSHPGADDRKVKCDLCDNYVLKEKLKRHKIMMHGSTSSKCGYCKTECDSRDGLIQHVTTCTAKKKKRKANEAGRELSECDVCHKTMQKASLRMHKAIKHAGLGPVCEHCGKRFGNKFRLNEHYRAKHGYEKFKCSYCEFQSAGVMSMRNHERRHRGEKPFVCETCGAKFHAAYLLAQHKQSHRTEKTVKCDLCPATFKANNSLHMHKSSCHSGSVYECGVCARAYRCRHYAAKHARQVHRLTGAAPLRRRAVD